MSWPQVYATCKSSLDCGFVQVFHHLLRETLSGRNSATLFQENLMYECVHSQLNDCVLYACGVDAYFLVWVWGGCTARADLRNQWAIFSYIS